MSHTVYSNRMKDTVMASDTHNKVDKRAVLMLAMTLCPPISEM